MDLVTCPRCNEKATIKQWHYVTNTTDDFHVRTSIYDVYDKEIYATFICPNCASATDIYKENISICKQKYIIEY